MTDDVSGRSRTGLPQAARAAWDAYVAMHDSKQAHFGYLEGLERKDETGGRRTLAEELRLHDLLAAHDRCVREFSSLINGLRMRDREAHAALLRQLMALNAPTAGGKRN
jgi:hypothetical protein